MNFNQRLRFQYLLSFKDLWSFSSGLLIEIVYPFLLKKADLVLVQHKGQEDILLKKNISSILFPNLIDLSKVPVILNPFRNDFIYVGSLKARKGFADFYELVHRTPESSFKVVGQPSDNEGYVFYEKLKALNNVALLGLLNHYNTLKEISNSKALISTSPMEGFPNVFIEAWACGIPVLYLHVDPGNVVEKERLGMVAYGNMESLVEAVRTLQGDDGYAERTRSYVNKTHALNIHKVNEINRIFTEILDDKDRVTTNLKG